MQRAAQRLDYCATTPFSTRFRPRAWQPIHWASLPLFFPYQQPYSRPFLESAQTTSPRLPVPVVRAYRRKRPGCRVAVDRGHSRFPQIILTALGSADRRDDIHRESRKVPNEEIDCSPSLKGNAALTRDEWDCAKHELRLPVEACISHGGVPSTASAVLPPGWISQSSACWMP